MNYLKPKSLFSEITSIPDVLNQKIYPSLNGLRAISIAMVIICHSVDLYYFKWRALAYLGGLGVDIFFVISGFLITSLCLKEKVKYGNISLKAFYTRRVLRILPVAYLYIVVLIMLNYIFKLDVLASSYLAAGLFLMNLSISRTYKFEWYLGHYWSLSVEEQFYILFPVLLKNNWRVYISVLLFIIFAVPVVYYLQTCAFVLNNFVLAALIRYLIKFQGIAIGCLYSVLLFKGYFNFGRARNVVTLLSIAVICYLPYSAVLNFRSVFTDLIISLFIGFVVVNNIYPSGNVLFRFLNLKIMSFVGMLSYSIYIWQQLFLSNNSHFPPSLFPLNLIFLMIASCGSYFLYERYFLKLKNKFSVLKQR